MTKTFLTEEERNRRISIFNEKYENYGYDSYVEWARAFGMYQEHPYIEGFFHYRAYRNGDDFAHAYLEVVYWGA